MYEQMDIFGADIPDTWSGKTCPEHCQATTAKTSAPSSKKRRTSSNRNALFLDLRTENGRTPDASWATDGPLHGAYTMRSFGECPIMTITDSSNPLELRSGVGVSRLSQILEAEVHPKYYLSAKACEGILRRAQRRGKELSPMLKEALERQSVSRATASTAPTPQDATAKAGAMMM